MKITNHIYFYPNKEETPIRSSNTAVIVGNDKQIIIDPGSNTNKRFENLVKEMEKDGLDINRTSEIWLSHSHPDHSQAIYDLSKRFKEQRLVRCHPLGKSLLTNPNLKKNFVFQERKKAGPYWRLLFSSKDRKKINQGTIWITLSMILEGISILWRKITNIKPFFDGEIVNIFPIKVRVVFLPGHTPDEIGFWIAKEKVLILGDLILIYKCKDSRVESKLVLVNFHSDLDQAISSLNKMRQIKTNTETPEILLSAHNNSVKGKENIQRIFDQLISKAKIYKVIAKDIIDKNPGLNNFQLIENLVMKLPGSFLLIEKRFIALAALKSLGIIK